VDDSVEDGSVWDDSVWDDSVGMELWKGHGRVRAA